MAERTDYLMRGGVDEWVAVAQYDFAGPTELDAAILAALEDDSLGDQLLYPEVDTEPAERFLSSVNGDDASVVFAISDRSVRVSSDGTIEVRAHHAEDTEA